MAFDNNTYFKLVADGKIQEAIDYAISNTPDYLYKFYSLSDGKKCSDIKLDKKKLKTLESNCNWFDFSRNQNDPLDMRMAYFDAEGLSIDPSMITAGEEICRRLPESFLLCSFIDTTTDNLPMWASYANGHRGYCIRYKIMNKKAVWRVLYAANRIPIQSIPLNLIQEMDESSVIGKETPKLEAYRYITFMLLNAKHESWDYEHEYRIILPAEGTIGQNFDNTMLKIVPQTVYVGYRCSDKYKEKIKEICRNTLHCECLVGKVGEHSILEFE